MSRASVSLDSSVGERITIALVLLTLCVEVLSDNGCRVPAPHMSLAECADICYPEPIHVMSREHCACALPPPPDNVRPDTGP